MVCTEYSEKTRLAGKSEAPRQIFSQALPSAATNASTSATYFGSNAAST
jgi:hypothetical protein